VARAGWGATRRGEAWSTLLRHRTTPTPVLDLLGSATQLTSASFTSMPDGTLAFAPMAGCALYPNKFGYILSPCSSS
jgi:hypothetical protein